MSPEVQAAEPTPVSEPLTPAGLAAGFLAELDAEQGITRDEPKQPEAPAQETEAAPETESAPQAEAEQPDQAEPSPEEPATPDIDAPRSMSESEKALWAQLPPEAKAWLAKREKETQADYTKKTQEIAEQRKAFEQAIPQLMGKLQQYDQFLSRFTAQAPQPPDPALKQTDPLAYDDQLAHYVHAKHQYDLAVQEQQRTRQEYQAHAEAQQRQFWSEQQKQLAQLAPELAAQTPEAKKTRQEVFAYAEKQGYSKEVLDNATARDLVTLWKAQKYDAALSKKPAVPVKPAAPKVMAPGPARAATRTNGFASAVRTLSENPSRQALKAAYLAEIAAES